MVNALLDSAIVVDLLRNHPPAVDWLARQAGLGATPVVWLEIIEGARDLFSQRRALKLLRRFDRVDIEPEDARWAIGKALEYRLSHGVGIMDCLIAAANHRLQLPLYTRNLKHFSPLLGSLARSPY